jgi:hypothetical protein
VLATEFLEYSALEGHFDAEMQVLSDRHDRPWSGDRFSGQKWASKGSEATIQRRTL